MIKLALVAVSLVLMLNGCSLVAGAVVGAAITPFVQPQVDRILGTVGLDFLDPGGVESVRSFDHKGAK